MAYYRRRRRPKSPSYDGGYNTPVLTGDPIVSEFDSWGSFVTYVEQGQSTAPASVNLSQQKGRDAMGEENWFDSDSFPDAVQLARNGKPEMCERIQQLLAPIMDKLTSLVEKQQCYMDVYSPMGLYDMSAVAVGLPECAYNFHTTFEDEKGTKIVRIVVNVCASAVVDTEALAIRGSVIAGLVQALELSGARTEIILVSAIGPSDHFKHNDCYVTIKRASDELDLPLLAYQVCSSAVLRRLMFKFCEIHGYPNRGYGHPADIPQSRQGDIYFASSHSSRINWRQYSDPEMALQFIREQLLGQGITLH